MKIKLTESQFKKLIEDIVQKDYTTNITSYDPEAGKIEWDIKYEMNLNVTYQKIDEIVKKIEKLVSQNKYDLQAKELLKISRLLRNKFSRYIV